MITSLYNCILIATSYNVCFWNWPEMASDSECEFANDVAPNPVTETNGFFSESENSMLFLSVLKKMQSSLDANNTMLAHLLADTQGTALSVQDDGASPSKRVRLTAAQSVSTPAAQSAQNPAPQSAQNSAAQSVENTAAMSVPTLDAQLVHNVADILPSATDIIRSSEEDALSLYGGGDFDQQGIEPTVDNTELLQFIDNSMILSEEAGPPLSEQLAKILNAKYLAEFDTSKRKELLNKYKIPSTCESFVVPKVNPEIWQKLPAHAKRGDMAIFTQQDTLLRFTSSISSVIEDLLSARQSKETPSYQHLIAKIIDSVALLGHVNRELSFKRRELLRPLGDMYHLLRG